MHPDPIPDDPTPGMHIWGWMSQPELRWLMAQAETMNSVAEVGCLHGRSAFALLTACEGEVWCVDPWDDAHDACYPSFKRSCGQFPNLRIARGYSPNVADDVPEVDMVFIDGNHDYEQVMVDIGTWLPKARKLICGHDYCNADAGFPGVAQAAHEVFGEVENPPETAIWAVWL